MYYNHEKGINITNIHLFIRAWEGDAVIGIIDTTIGIISSLAIFYIYAKWINEKISARENPNLFIIYVAPPILTYGLLWGLGYTGYQPLFVMSSIIIGSSILCDRQFTSTYLKPLKIDLNRIETVLDESRAIFKLLLEGAPGIICLHDMEGNIIHTNKNASNKLGYSDDELETLNVDKFIDPEIYFEGMRNIIENEGPTFESLITRKDGTQYPAEIYGNAATLKGEAILLGYIRDISRLKKAEEELRKAREEKEPDMPSKLLAV